MRNAQAGRREYQPYERRVTIRERRGVTEKVAKERVVPSRCVPDMTLLEQGETDVGLLLSSVQMPADGRHHDDAIR